MKALQVAAAWKPREGYTPNEKEIGQKRAIRGNLIWHNPKIEIVEKDVPVPKDDEVLLKVGATGVCGSDTAFLGKDADGYTHYSGHCKLPCVLGHEYSGEVVEKGKQVKNLAIGDLVAGETMSWCGECDACRMGMFNQCTNLEEIGFTQDGSYAEYMVVKEKYCFKINDLIERYGSKQKALNVGALVEPVAGAYNGMFIRGGGFMPGSHVAVFGCGPMGLASIALAKAAGAGKIVGFDLSEKRMQMAKKIGADYVFNSNQLIAQGSSPSQAVEDVTQGSGAGLLVEATEHIYATLPEIEKSMAVGGKVIQLGISSRKAEISAFHYQKHGCSYYGSVGSSGYGIYQMVIRLMALGRLDLSSIISKTFSINDALAALEEGVKAEEGKYLVTPNI